MNVGKMIKYPLLTPVRWAIPCLRNCLMESEHARLSIILT